MVMSTTLLPSIPYPTTAIGDLAPGDFFVDADGDTGVVVFVTEINAAVTALLFENRDGGAFSYEYSTEELVTPLRAEIRTVAK